VSILLDTDWYSDVDDVVALRVLDWGVIHQTVTLLGVALSTTLSAGAGSLQSVLANDGITGVPIALSHTPNVPGGTPAYQSDLRTRGIAAGYITGSETYGDAVTQYRTLLAAAPAQSVDVVSIGPLNNLRDVLQSPADGISSLTGAQLVASRVKRLWVMGGANPSGTEYNFNNNALAINSAHYVVANWPTPIIYNGFEIGNTILTGASVSGRAPGDLLAQALVDFGSSTRNSWDPMAVLAALLADPDHSGFSSVWGSNTVDAGTGANTFTANVTGRDRYLVKMNSDASFQSRINNFLDKTLW